MSCLVLRRNLNQICGVYGRILSILGVANYDFAYFSDNSIINMVLTIPTEYIHAARLTEREILLEIAVLFFHLEKLTLGQAARLARLPQYKFQWVLAGRDIPIHYGIEDYEEDLQTIRALES